VRTNHSRTLGLKIAGTALLMALAGSLVALADHDFEFEPGTLVLSRSVYAGNSNTVNVGQTLPPDCVPGIVNVPLIAGGTTPVTVPSNSSSGCTVAVADGTYPTVFNNNSNNGKAVDGSFGVTSPIFLDNITTDGKLLSTLPIPSHQIVTSFSSKSELALNLSLDGRSITFVGYRGGPAFATGPNHLDVSNSNTPGVVDPTNPAVSQFYRSVAEVDAHGHMHITEGNAYSGNNGRAAIKADSRYYLTGNDNNGGLSKTQLSTTQVGVNLVNSTGVELLFPGQAPSLPPNINKIGDFEVNQVGYGTADKPGKDNNFRGLTIFNDTLYVTKGSGGNGINTVYQVGTAGNLPTLLNAPGGDLLKVPITILPGFPTTLASGVALDLVRQRNDALRRRRGRRYARLSTGKRECGRRRDPRHCRPAEVGFQLVDEQVAACVHAPERFESGRAVQRCQWAERRGLPAQPRSRHGWSAQYHRPREPGRNRHHLGHNIHREQQRRPGRGSEQAREDHRSSGCHRGNRGALQDASDRPVRGSAARRVLHARNRGRVLRQSAWR
jgi:hypothetical protein